MYHLGNMRRSHLYNKFVSPDIGHIATSDLAKKYQYLRPQIQKFHKGCLDTFSYYGKEVDLSTVKNRKVLLQFTLHYQHIIQRYQNFYKAAKGDKDSAIQKAFCQEGSNVFDYDALLHYRIQYQGRLP